MRVSALSCLPLLLAACAGSPDAEIDGPFYTQGVTDGCKTAEARREPFNTSRYRDDELFAKEPSYQAGWRAGYNECRPIGIGGVQPTNPGAAESPL